MTDSESESEVRDRPAEQGITINNILLGLLLMGGSIFGTMMVNDVDTIKKAISKVSDAVTSIKVKNGEYGKEISHNTVELNKLEQRVNKINQRVFTLERKVK